MTAFQLEVIFFVYPGFKLTQFDGEVIVYT